VVTVVFPAGGDAANRDLLPGCASLAAARRPTSSKEITATSPWMKRAMRTITSEVGRTCLTNSLTSGGRGQQSD